MRSVVKIKKTLGFDPLLLERIRELGLQEREVALQMGLPVEGPPEFSEIVRNLLKLGLSTRRAQLRLIHNGSVPRGSTTTAKPSGQ